MPIRPSLLVTLGLLSGLTPFAIDMYLPSLPAIALDLGSTIELAQLTVTVPVPAVGFKRIYTLLDKAVFTTLETARVIACDVPAFHVTELGTAPDPTWDVDT